MNKIINLIKTCFVIILIAHFNGCQQKKENPTTTLFEETMDLHDVAMARMSEIYTLKKSLTKKNDSLFKVGPVDSVSQKEFILLMEQLEEADEAMMSWMAQFETKYKNDDTEESLNYYKDQKEKILAVSKSMDEAIARAKEATKD
ncbi:MAG: hypothetical protein MI921_19995 [Cytophagales bacterium]|nr:hypothetical protein [Cytophagales bacterium]